MTYDVRDRALGVIHLVLADGQPSCSLEYVIDALDEAMDTGRQECGAKLAAVREALARIDECARTYERLVSCDYLDGRRTAYRDAARMIREALGAS